MNIWLFKKESALYPYSDEDKRKIDKIYKDEPVMVKHVRVRNPKLHRLYFAFMNLCYENLPESLEKNYPSFNAFRKSIEMYAGHYEETISLKGDRVLIHKSIRYEELDDTAFQELYKNVKAVIGKHFLPNIEDYDREIEMFYG